MSDPIDVDLLDETLRYTLADICRICSVQEQLVVEIVEEGIVEPLGDQPPQWRFNGIAVTRIQRVIQLQHDFDVNLPGAALALELLEEIERLKRALGR
ncbi:MAG TPA: chaperone modulator CbpM [Gammaproteobacteria bacterium]|jgi:chaperone modulatory protein CbpM|nr:chaperone modulator CbpM [Gammaproteobacteria bacterium]